MEVTLLASSIVATLYAQKNVDQIIKANSTSHAPLYDIIHANTIDLSKYEQLIDLIPLTLGCFVLYLVLFHNLNIRKIFLMTAIIFLLRAFTITATILPSPICRDGKQSKAMGGCSDCIFSGHMACTLLYAYLIYKHTRAYKYLLLLYCILSGLFISMTRSHYTIDVIVAWLAVYAIIKCTDPSF